MSIVDLQQMLQIRALPETHGITKAFALLTFGCHSQEQAELHKGQSRWCKLVKGQWKKLWVFPLSADVPQWPVEPTVVDASSKKLVEAALSTYRVIFPKRFLTNPMGHCSQFHQRVAAAMPDGRS